MKTHDMSPVRLRMPWQVTADRNAELGTLFLRGVIDIGRRP
jgi:hypothetical protein